MKRKLVLNFLATTALLLPVTVAAATVSVVRTDAEIAAQTAREIRTYSRYTIWDNVELKVTGGVVTLAGQVSQPFKKKDLERIAIRVPGVTRVENGLEVLPTSFYDDEIRIRVARAIYRDPALSRYAFQVVPPIHIIVKNGQVSLEGVVNNEAEKTIAFHRAAGAGLTLGPIVNNLRVENPRRAG